MLWLIFELIKNSEDDYEDERETNLAAVMQVLVEWSTDT